MKIKYSNEEDYYKKDMQRYYIKTHIIEKDKI